MLQRILNKTQELCEWAFPTPDPEVSLFYFDIAGLAQASRDVMNDSDMSFTDIRLSHDEFLEKKADFPFEQLPVLKIHDEQQLIAQSKTILRYVGTICKVYPRKNILNSAIVDQWLELHTEFMFPLQMNMYPNRFGLNLSDTDKKDHRKWCVQTHIPKYLKKIEAQLEDCEFICTGSKSAADYCWLATLNWLASGIFDGVDISDLNEFTEIVSYMNRNGQINFDEDTSNDINSVD